MKYALLLTCALAGCSTLPPAPTEVLVPVPIRCINPADVPPRDFLHDSALAKLGDRELVITLRIEQLRLRNWIDQAAALMQACFTP